MSFEGLQHEPDVSVGAWIAPRLRGLGGRVHCLVPDGFEAYARIMHPAEDGEKAVTWAEVCRRTGRTAHALMQWHSIAGEVQHTRTEGRWPRRRSVVRTTSEWPGSAPRQGELPPAQLSAVLDVLAGFTADGADCYSALWEGWGWLNEGSWGVLVASDHLHGRPPCVRPEPAGLPDDVLAGPRLRHPGRDYLLFRGPLRAALRMGHQVRADWFDPQSPNLLWPPDRSWCLATEIDFDSTVVGGPQTLVDALLQAPELEVWTMDADADLTYDGDTVNR